MKKFKDILVDVFNDDIYSSVISKRVNTFIIILIVISTLEIILGTEPSLSQYKNYFDVVFYFTSGLFFIEMLMRFVVSSHVNKKYEGFLGKIRFSFDFYNLIDILSIIPFVFGVFGVEMFLYLKALRVFRIIKILRYLPAIDLLKSSINSKKSELFVSFETILILALLLSIGLYYAEHNVEGSHFSSISQAMAWSVAKFIGEIAGYGDFTPETSIGQFLATLNGLLGIALFAVPAGIIGSGFIEEIEERQNKKKYQNSINNLKDAFYIEYYGPAMKIKKDLGLSEVPRKWLSMDDIRFKMRMTENDVFQACAHSELFRLRNVKFDGVDKAGLEFINSNSPYGQFVDRGSTLTIVNMFPSEQPFFGHFSMCMSHLLGANYISNEIFSKQSLLSDFRKSLVINSEYTQNEVSDDLIKEFLKDLNQLLHKPDSTLIFMVNAASSERLLQFNTGAEKGINSIKGGVYFRNSERVEKYFTRANACAEKYDLKADAHVTVGRFQENHLIEYLHANYEADILAVHLNVSVLKRQIVDYYQIINDVASVFKD